jgi:hypothetical protein
MPSTVTLSGPGTATITDDAAAVLLVQLPLLIIELEKLHSASQEINKNIIELQKASTAMAASTKAQEVALIALNAATSQSNAIQAAAASNQIKTNLFQVQATKDALTRTGQPLPVLPDIPTQIQSSVQDGVTMITTATVTGAVVSTTNSAIIGMGTWIAGTKVYKTVSGWFDDVKDFFFVTIPDNAKQAASKIAAKLPGGG